MKGGNVKDQDTKKGVPGGKFEFLQGGSGHMYGRSGAEPVKPGTTAPPGKQGTGGKFIEGGHGNHMFPRSGASPMPAGETARGSSAPKGSDKQFAQGGHDNHMFGRRGSQKRSPGETGGM